MSTPSPLFRRIAERLAAHAARVLPENRDSWARAMRNEIVYMPRGRDALRWALGCVVASYLERSRIMNVGTLRVSRWVLAVEMLVCFFWLTGMFGALVSRGLYGSAWPLPMDAWFFTMLSGTAVGPIGLVAAFKSVVLGRPRLSRATEALLCVPAAWTFLGFGGQLLARGGWFIADPDRAFDALALFILFAALPALGVAHLVYLSRGESRTAIAA